MSSTFPSLIYSEPAALGLLTNILPALASAIVNFTERDCFSGIPNCTAKFASAAICLLSGTFTQLISSWFLFQKTSNRFGGVVDGTLASWWAAIAFNYLFPTLMPSRTQVAATYGALALSTVVLAWNAMLVNRVLPWIFLSFAVANVFTIVGLYVAWGSIVAAAALLCFALGCAYGATGFLLKAAAGRHLLWGFDGALINILLKKSSGSKEARKIARSKSTKAIEYSASVSLRKLYAPPQALGYFAAAVPLVVAAADNFRGDIPSAAASIWMVASGGIGNVIAAIIAFLRFEKFWGTSYILSSAFWTSLGFSSLASGSKGMYSAFTGAGMVGVTPMFALLAFVALLEDTVAQLHFGLMSCMTLGLCVVYLGGGSSIVVGAFQALAAAVAFYGALATLTNAIVEKDVFPVGGPVAHVATLMTTVARFVRDHHLDPQVQRHYRRDPKQMDAAAKWKASQEAPQHPDKVALGDSSLACPAGVGSLSSLVVALTASVALLHGTTGSNSTTVALDLAPGEPFSLYTLDLLQVGAWLFGFGLLGHGYAAVTHFLRGETMQGCIFFVSASCTIGVAVVLSVIGRHPYLGMGLVGTAALAAMLLIVVPTSTAQLAWLLYTVHLVAALASLIVLSAAGTVIPTVIVLLSLSCLSTYMAAAALLRGAMLRTVLPLGPILWQVNYDLQSDNRKSCPTFDASSRRDLTEFSQILLAGGVVGIPTDSVYAIAACANNTHGVRRIYQVKNRPSEKPISLWVASKECLRACHPPFSNTLWAFMDRIWPGPVSIVVSRGDWLMRLGITGSAEMIGTKHSIAIRVPDSVAVCALIELTGPLAITSANPSGEPDTTHHSEVVARLGDKIDGVLSGGTSPGNIASTVVDCTQEDRMSFFRVGIMPEEFVREAFEDARRQVKGSLLLDSTETSTSRGATSANDVNDDELAAAADSSTDGHVTLNQVVVDGQ